MRRKLSAVLWLLAAAGPCAADALDELAREFWVWRAVDQPQTGDDIPRIDRPAGWRPDWSPASIGRRRKALAGFEQRWKQINAAGWPVARQVDYRLIGSALARVKWELDLNPGWRRDALFYVDQTLGTIFELLLEPPPFSAARSREIVLRLQSIPATLEHARQNLDGAARPFAERAIGSLDGVRARLDTVARELKPLLAAGSAAQLDDAAAKAGVALEAWRGWLVERLPSLGTTVAVGREAYVFFLDQVALMPFTPEQLLAMGRQEWDRAVAFEALELERNRGLPALPLAPSMMAQIDRQGLAEIAVREYCEKKGLLTFPTWLKRYNNLPLPSYLEPLSSLGVTDDLTSPARLDQDAFSYVRAPTLSLGYFALATARDPRVMIVHEGMHYYQLALSWKHENPIRRHYYDSGPNEGIGFYAEEMMLQAGLFDNSPRTREIIYNFARLRALRVEVDVKLALGEMTIAEAARYLETAVPMDAATAAQEAAFFAATPGQAISYQIGKLQILEFLAAARRARGGAFRLRDFHDFLWKNGNVPIALQRLEYGLR